MTVRSLSAALFLLAVLSACQKPPEAPAPSAAPAVHEPAAEAANAEAATTIPDSVPAIWQAVDQRNAELKAAVDGGSLADVHHLAFAIRDLVAALPAKQPALDAAAKAKLQGEVGFVDTLAGRLDQSGDANDRAATQANYQQLAAVLGGMTREPAKP
jgi:hypothetical protein